MDWVPRSESLGIFGQSFSGARLSYACVHVCVCVCGCGWSWALFDVVRFLPKGQNQLGPLTDPQLKPILETALCYLPPGQVS